ncbi:MAG TPA: four helix bundle protein [Bacteroidota bacterium]|nr:four helix bundle protein [Bacteroidota bacterium]
MDSNDLKKRTKRFALDVIELVSEVPSNRASDILCRQLLRSATSVGANYRSACRARSKADFISKITIVEEEADESLYWLELLTESGIERYESIVPLIREADELTAIFTAAGKTAKGKRA